MLKVERKKALELSASHSFRGIAYDGFWFYLTVEDKNKIEKYDASFNQVECFETCKSYTYICYDSIEDCFWAADRESLSCIFKLNTCFELIDEFSISIPGVRGGKITGISHNCKSDTLLISFSNTIVSIENCSVKDCRIIYSSRKKRIRGVTDIFSSCICYGITRPKQEIRIASLNGRVIKRFNIPSDFCIESMVSVPSVRNGHKSHLYVLVTNRNGEQFVWEFIVEDCNKREHERENCCCDALESIASEGVKIAHCLNVESDRLIDIIFCSNNAQEIHEAMVSLRKLIDRAACQEKELTDKLQKLMEHCDFCKMMDSYEDED